MRDTQIESFRTSFHCPCFVIASLCMKTPSGGLFIKIIVRTHDAYEFCGRKGHLNLGQG